MSLIGSLEEIKLADVLRLFAQGKKTGRLIVTAEEDHRSGLLRDVHLLRNVISDLGLGEGEDALVKPVG